jgi:hypothetical protein
VHRRKRRSPESQNIGTPSQLRVDFSQDLPPNKREVLFCLHNTYTTHIKKDLTGLRFVITLDGVGRDILTYNKFPQSLHNPPYTNSVPAPQVGCQYQKVCQCSEKFHKKVLDKYEKPVAGSSGCGIVMAGDPDLNNPDAR